jgi:hypothetical protein
VAEDTVAAAVAGAPDTTRGPAVRARFKGLVTAVAVVLTGAAAISGCRVTTAIDRASGQGNVTYCAIIADPPVQTRQVIDAPGRFRCDDAGADTITMTVDLQKRDATGAWHTLASRTFVAHGDDTTRVRSESARTRVVSVACATGWFRTALHAVEVSGGASRSVDTRSVPVPSPCSYRG